MKVFRLTSGVAIKIPQDIVHALQIRPGDYFDLLISDKETIVARRLKIIKGEEFGEARDDMLPKVKNGEPNTTG